MALALECSHCRIEFKDEISGLYLMRLEITLRFIISISFITIVILIDFRWDYLNTKIQ